MTQRITTPLFEFKVTSEPGSLVATGTVQLVKKQQNHKPYLRVQAMAQRKGEKFPQSIYEGTSGALRLQGDDITTEYSFSVPLTYCPPDADYVLLILTGGRGGEVRARVEPPRTGLQEPPLWWRLRRAFGLAG